MDEMYFLFIILVVITAIAASSFFLYTFLYDPNANEPDYCNVYARQVLGDLHLTLPYAVNENIAANSCTEPHWDMVCTDTPENRKRPQCMVARSEPKFRIAFVQEI